MKKLKSLSEQVYDYIIRQIQLGELSKGSKLSESDLIEQLSISRTPIREALIQLSADGILENVQRKGFFVKTPTWKEIIENYKILARLDAYAAELALPLLTDKDLNRMEALANHIAFAIEQKDYNLYTDEQEAFHDVYLEQCGNAHLIEMIHHMLKRYIRPLNNVNDATLFKQLEEINKDHYQIVELFRKKDLKQLQECIIAHWSRAEHDFPEISEDV
mgnify:CR=1 FL=1